MKKAAKNNKKPAKTTAAPEKTAPPAPRPNPAERARQRVIASRQAALNKAVFPAPEES